jgi:hypothetical protein
MTARFRGEYQALSQSAELPRRWWARVPQPIVTAVVNAWSALPHIVRAPFIPLGRWINPHQTTTSSALDSPRPDTVVGVLDLRAQGFEPIEEYTGAVEVAQLWPDSHRRSVPETRAAWLDAPDCDGRLWIVRSPWPSVSLRDALNLLWRWVERDHARLDDDLWRQRVSEALAWDDKTAAEWHRQTKQ